MHATPRTKILSIEPHTMSDWSDQLLKISFQKIETSDGAVRYCYEAADRRASFWTEITVKQVGRPQPDSWQVTYARSELQVGFWKLHSVVKDIDVIVYKSSEKMVESIKQQISIKPTFLQRITN